MGGWGPAAVELALKIIMFSPGNWRGSFGKGESKWDKKETIPMGEEKDGAGLPECRADTWEMADDGQFVTRGTRDGAKVF